MIDEEKEAGRQAMIDTGPEGEEEVFALASLLVLLLKTLAPIQQEPINVILTTPIIPGPCDLRTLTCLYSHKLQYLTNIGKYLLNP